MLVKPLSLLTAKRAIEMHTPLRLRSLDEMEDADRQGELGPADPAAPFDLDAAVPPLPPSATSPSPSNAAAVAPEVPWARARLALEHFEGEALLLVFFGTPPELGGESRTTDTAQARRDAVEARTRAQASADLLAEGSREGGRRVCRIRRGGRRLDHGAWNGADLRAPKAVERVAAACVASGGGGGAAWTTAHVTVPTSARRSRARALGARRGAVRGRRREPPRREAARAARAGDGARLPARERREPRDREAVRSLRASRHGRSGRSAQWW